MQNPWSWAKFSQIFSKSVRIWLRCGVWVKHHRFWVKHHRCWSNSTDFEWMIWVESGVIVQTRFCGEWNLEFGSNTTEKFEISRGEAEWDFKFSVVFESQIPNSTLRRSVFTRVFHICNFSPKWIVHTLTCPSGAYKSQIQKLFFLG